MTRLSNRQFPMLRRFASNPDAYMTITEAQKWDQRPFRSMLIQGWVAFRPGHGFHVTREGMQAWHEFRQTDIKRLHPESPLTRYFDPAAYGLEEPVKSKGAA